MSNRIRDWVSSRLFEKHFRESLEKHRKHIRREIAQGKMEIENEVCEAIAVILSVGFFAGVILLRATVFASEQEQRDIREFLRKIRDFFTWR